MRPISPSYTGTSPDEICLVSAARQFGFVFLGVTSKTSVLNIMGQEREFEVVSFFEFDNKRKMMSVIIKENGVYKLLCKGADSSILGRLAKSDQPFLAATTERLNEYSKLGLRTLCMAIRVLSQEEVNTIRQKLLGLSVAGKERDNLMGRPLS